MAEPIKRSGHVGRNNHFGSVIGENGFPWRNSASFKTPSRSRNTAFEAAAKVSELLPTWSGVP